MIRQFRTISALMRQTWLMEPVTAEHYLPLINNYLAGQYAQSNENDPPTGPDEPAGYFLSQATTISTSARTRVPLLRSLATALGGAENSAPNLVRYELDSEELPDNSIFVLDIRGPIFKESTCCAYGTEEYAQLMEAAYQNEKVIGIVCLVDSPGGQLSGTPTLYDAIRDPRKPTVSVINEGMMASAALWLACGSDDIYATQKTDQVGSIGVFVQFRDASEAQAKAGIKTFTIYSDRSTEKNKPYRDALAGDDTLIRDDLNQAADLFRQAVEQGRGDRLKPAAEDGPDIFKGGLFYASKAIELGLIDGYGNLSTAIDRVMELHNARQSQTPVSAPVPGFKPFGTTQQAQQSAAPAATLTPTESTEVSPETTSSAAPEPGDTPPADPTAVVEPAPTTEPQTPNPTESMSSIFGFIKLPAVAALQGVAADQVTEAQIDAANKELAAEGYNIAVISAADFAAAQTLQANLNTANGTIATLNAEIARLGKQAGAMGTSVPKTTETPAAGSEQNPHPFFSETDAMAAKQRKPKL